jgi:hypothetical protein
MAAPKGNQFWKLRSKPGRDTVFATPELMWEAACEYFQWCEDNPFQKSEAKVVNIGDYQSKVEKVKLDVLRPFTMEGLCLYLDCGIVYFNHFEKALEGKTDAVSQDFKKVVTRIREVIRDQKFTGAAAGFFNANIIARDLGLKDQSDVTTNGEKIQSNNLDISGLPDEVLLALLKSKDDKKGT